MNKEKKTDFLISLTLDFANNNLRSLYSLSENCQLTPPLISSYPFIEIRVHCVEEVISYFITFDPDNPRSTGYNVLMSSYFYESLEK